MNFDQYIKKQNDEIKHHGYIILEDLEVKTMTTPKLKISYKKWTVDMGSGKLLYYDLIFCETCKCLFFRGSSPNPRPYDNWLKHCNVHQEFCSK